MGMTVQRRKDTQTPRVFMHKVADIRGGVSVATSDLGADFLAEGSVLSQPVNGICHVVKIATIAVAVGASDKTVTVKKGAQFNVGDIVMMAEDGKATSITAIDTTGKTTDKITLKAALGEAAIGGFLVQATAEQTTSGAAIKYAPFALVGTGKPVIAGDNINTDAWVIGVTKGNPLPSFVAEALKGIIDY